MSTQITIVGNLTGEPEQRYTPQGKAVTNFNLAVNERRFNRDTNQWEDGDTTFYSVSVWGPAAENAAATLKKGMEAIVMGSFKARQYQTREGENRLSLDVTVTAGNGAVGPSLRWVQGEMQRGQGSNPQGGQQAAQDPWNSAPPTGGFGQGGADNPPF